MNVPTYKKYMQLQKSSALLPKKVILISLTGHSKIELYNNMQC